MECRKGTVSCHHTSDKTLHFWERDVICGETQGLVFVGVNRALEWPVDKYGAGRNYIPLMDPETGSRLCWWGSTEWVCIASGVEDALGPCLQCRVSWSWLINLRGKGEYCHLKLHIIKRWGVSCIIIMSPAMVIWRELEFSIRLK